MEIIALLIGLVIVAAIVFYVSHPLVQSRRAGQPNGAVDIQSLETQRESLYIQIKELDLDHATGKVNEEDYVRLRAELVAQAVAVLKQIDGVAPQPAPASPPDDVEALIAARRKTRSTSASRTVDADAEAAIAARRRTSAPSASELACPTCGKPIGADDAFCARCGTALRTQLTS